MEADDALPIYMINASDYTLFSKLKDPNTYMNDKGKEWQEILL